MNSACCALGTSPEMHRFLVESRGWIDHRQFTDSITLAQTARGVLQPSSRPYIFDARARLRGLRDFWLRRFGPPPD